MKEKLDDFKIIAEFRKNPMLGLRLLIESYEKYIKKHANLTFELTGHALQTAVDDVFLKAYENLSEFKPCGQNSLRNWLYTILKNIVIDNVRAQRTIADKNIYIETFDESEYDELGEDESLRPVLREINKVLVESYTDREVRKDNQLEIIYEIIRDMTKEEQEYIFYYCECTPYKEVATDTSKKEDTVKKGVNRAVIKFCQIVADKFNKDYKIIYERVKEKHKEDIEGRITGR